MKKVISVMVSLIVCSLVFSGCGYRLGSSLPAGIKSVYVPTFVNKSGEPQIDALATSAVLQEFQRDGSLEVADASFADTILKVTVTKFTLEAVRYEQDDRKRTKEYRLRIDAEFEFSKVSTGEVLQKRRVFGETLFEPTSDLASGKRAALPDGCEDLAHQIVKTVVEFW